MECVGPKCGREGSRAKGPRQCSRNRRTFSHLPRRPLPNSLHTHSNPAYTSSSSHHHSIPSCPCHCLTRNLDQSFISRPPPAAPPPPPSPRPFRPIPASLHHLLHQVLRHIDARATPARIWLLSFQPPRLPPTPGPQPRRTCPESAVRTQDEGEGVKGRQRQAAADAGAELVEGRDKGGHGLGLSSQSSCPRPDGHVSIWVMATPAPQV